jgi:hypothetical protein
MWTIADDSGLDVDALAGAPGPHSARLAGPRASDAERRRTLLALLKPFARPWTSCFRCTMALASPEGSVDLAVGMCEVEIVPQESGAGGFGYDRSSGSLAVTGRWPADRAREEPDQPPPAVQALLPTLRRRIGLQDP